MKEKIIRSIGLIWERLYPYIIAVLVTIVVVKNKLNYVDNSSINDAANAVLTVASIIIGFIGAILPVILGMRNDSAFVKYVLSMDKENLFSKYVKEVLGLGLLLISVSIIMMFKDNYSRTWLHNHIFYGWVFLVISFLLGTYRSVGSMLKLAFYADKNFVEPLKPSVQEKTDEQIKFEEQYSKKHE